VKIAGDRRLEPRKNEGAMTWNFRTEIAEQSELVVPQTRVAQRIARPADNAKTLHQGRVSWRIVPIFSSSSDSDHTSDTDSGTGTTTQERTRTRTPRLYRVVLLNDDFTPMDFVIHVLQKFFQKDYNEANRITMQVHHQGSGVAGVFSYEIAETKVYQVHQYARQNQYPLKCTLEPA